MLIFSPASVPAWGLLLEALRASTEEVSEIMTENTLFWCRRFDV